MNITFATAAALLLAAATPALADHPAVAQQGGRLAEAHGHRLELVTKGTVLEVLLKDAHNQPMSAEGWSGKAVVMAPGGKADVPLAPDGARLVGSIPAGAELAATVLALKGGDGHSMTARLPALQPATPPAAALAAKGEPIYATHCVECHGDKMQGQEGWLMQPPPGAEKLAPPLDATGHGWHHSDEDLATAIRNGAEPMPPYADVLSEAEIQAVIAWFKSAWPAATQAQQPKAPGAKPAAATASGHHGH